MKARVTLLHKPESEWIKLGTFKPEPGEIVLYDPDDNYDYVRIKAGDGVHTIQELDFCVDRAVAAALSELKYATTADGGRITEYFK